jgi:hypothetical protein
MSFAYKSKKIPKKNPENPPNTKVARIVSLLAAARPQKSPTQNTTILR